jgi:hypothetical protein
VRIEYHFCDLCGRQLGESPRTDNDGFTVSAEWTRRGLGSGITQLLDLDFAHLCDECLTVCRTAICDARLKIDERADTNRPEWFREPSV